MPETPVLYISGEGVYRWDTDTNTVSMLADTFSFSTNISLSDTAVFRLRDGTLLAPLRRSVQLMTAVPWAQKG